MVSGTPPSQGRVPYLGRWRNQSRAGCFLQTSIAFLPPAVREPGIHTSGGNRLMISMMATRRSFILAKRA